MRNVLAALYAGITTTTLGLRLMTRRFGTHNELVGKHLLPDLRQSVEYTFRDPNGECVLPFSSCHQSDGNRCRLDMRDAEPGSAEEILPAFPHKEPNVSPVEKAFFVLRK